MAEQHIQTVLTAAGIDTADFEALKALPADAADFKPDTYVGKIRTGVETILKNDPKFWEGLNEENVNETFKKRIQDQQYGRAANIAKQKVQKALGLTDEDIADLTDEEKGKYELSVAKYAEKYAKSKAGDKQLQADLLTARQKLEALEAGLPEKETALKTQYQTQFNNEKIDYIVLAELASIPDLKVPANYIADKVAAELKDGYDLKINGLKAEPKQKGKDLDVMEGSKILGLKDLVTKILVRDGLIGEKKADEPITGKTKLEIEGDGKNELKISSHILEQRKELL